MRRRAAADGQPLAEPIEVWVADVLAAAELDRAGGEATSDDFRSGANGSPTDDASATVSAWITTSEAAERLETSTRNVVDLIARRRLIAERVGRSWRIDPESVVEFAEARDDGGAGARGRDADGRGGHRRRAA
jgi:excisionase family DNA binding protein